MDLFGLGPLEILLVLVIMLIVFGPHKVPEIAAQIGKTVREFRKAATDITREFNQEVAAAKSEVKSATDATKGLSQDLAAIKSDINSTTNMPKGFHQQFTAANSDSKPAASATASTATDTPGTGITAIATTSAAPEPSEGQR